MLENTAYLSIKKWPDNDRPREKLKAMGAGHLSDAELLAILIGSGSSRESALSLARRIFQDAGADWVVLGDYSPERLMQFRGIGLAKAVGIAAALEIGKRRRNAVREPSQKITSSKQVYELMYPHLGELPHEEFWIVYLNNANVVLHKALLSKGGITGTLVDVRLVLKKALELRAVALILAHNHPSGTLKPSEADKALTNKLKKGANAIDLKVLDHLILTPTDYFSFADNNLL